jgi:hypothetical protein
MEELTMSKVVHLSDQAHNRAKAYCQRRGLKMSEWVASLIERATEGKIDNDPTPSVHMPSGALGDVGPQASAIPSTTLQASEVAPEVGSYQALGPKKKLTQAVAAPQSLPEGATPVYEAPPFWAR